MKIERLTCRDAFQLPGSGDLRHYIVGGEQQPNRRTYDVRIEQGLVHIVDVDDESQRTLVPMSNVTFLIATMPAAEAKAAKK